MKTAMIGASGHSVFCVPEAFCKEREFTAIAPGSRGESVKDMIRGLERLGYPIREYGDYREMLRREKPEVVIVDNYYGEHGPVILDAFGAGCHVLAEKPVAVSLEELEQMEEAWKRAGTKFGAMFTYRYEGAFCGAKQLIDAGAVGRVRLLNAQKSYKFGKRPEFMTRRESYGGTINWVGIHGIDWILWMSGGKVQSVSAVQSAQEAENGVCPETAALAQFRLNDGMMASLTVDYLNPATAPVHGDDRIRVVGTEGVIEVRENRIFLINGEGIQQPANLSGGDMFADFLDQIQGKAEGRMCAEEIFAVSRAAIMAQMAADTGEIIRWK